MSVVSMFCSVTGDKINPHHRVWVTDEKGSFLFQAHVTEDVKDGLRILAGAESHWSMWGLRPDNVRVEDGEPVVVL